MFLGLLVAAAVFIGAVVMIAGCIVAFVKRDWRIAGWSIGGTLGALAALLGVISFMISDEDEFVRKSVTNEAVAGTYDLDPGWAEGRLLKMGYKDGSGQITFKPDGSFTATRIPACCIHGLDESTHPFSGGYYSLAGTWTTATSSKFNANFYVVEIVMTTAQLSDQQPKLDPALLKERVAPHNLEIDLVKGTPLSLGFNIYNGDFEHVLFLKRSR